MIGAFPDALLLPRTVKGRVSLFTFEAGQKKTAAGAALENAAAHFGLDDGIAVPVRYQHSRNPGNSCMQIRSIGWKSVFPSIVVIDVDDRNPDFFALASRHISETFPSVQSSRLITSIRNSAHTGGVRTGPVPILIFDPPVGHGNSSFPFGASAVDHHASVGVKHLPGDVR